MSSEDLPILSDMKKELLKEEVKDFMVNTSMNVCDFIGMLRDSHGFMAGHVYEASRILAEMWMDKDTTKILSFTANLVATGLRGVFTQLIREGFVDIVITTCGTIDHDIARGTGHKYYKGSFYVDDSMLRELDIHRLGNIYIPIENYGLAIERFVRDILSELTKVKKEWKPSEIIYEVGKRIDDPFSILKAAADRNVPVIVPGITDGAFGTQLVLNSQFTGLKIDILGDEKVLADKIFSSTRIGALIIGGGISKHHTIWWAQFKDGLDYAVYVTTAVEYDGSLSGAQPREAISWGKIKPTAKQAIVYGDATVYLPLIVAGAKCIIEKRIQ